MRLIGLDFARIMWFIYGMETENLKEVRVYRRNVETLKPYFLSPDADEKQPSRERVLNHIVKYHQSASPIKFLGMPGLRWKFEWMLLEKFKRAVFIGVEKERAIFEKSLGYMPGKAVRKSSKIDKFLNLDGATTEWKTEFSLALEPETRARHLCVDLSLLMDMYEFANEKNQQKHLRRRYAHITAFWLDGFSNLSTTIPILQKLPSILSGKYGDIIPFAITVFIGHDTKETVAAMNAICPSGSAIERRALLTRAVLSTRSNCEIDDFWTYENMGVICGRIVIKTPV